MVKLLQFKIGLKPLKKTKNYFALVAFLRYKIAPTEQNKMAFLYNALMNYTCLKLLNLWNMVKLSCIQFAYIKRI
jgi:hypothetical protein